MGDVHDMVDISDIVMVVDVLDARRLLVEGRHGWLSISVGV